MSNIKNKIINKARIYLLFLWLGVLIYFIFYSPFNIIELNIYSLNFEAIFSIFLSFWTFLTFSAIWLEIFSIYKLKTLFMLVVLFSLNLLIDDSISFMIFMIHLVYLPFLAKLTNSVWNNPNNFQSFFWNDKESQKNI